MTEHAPTWLSVATIVIFVLSLVVLGLAVWNLVRTIKQTQTTRWTILRTQVYNKRLLESREELERTKEAILEQLKGTNQ